MRAWVSVPAFAGTAVIVLMLAQALSANTAGTSSEMERLAFNLVREATSFMLNVHSILGVPEFSASPAAWNL